MMCCCLWFRRLSFIAPIDDNLRGLVAMDAPDSSSIAITATVGTNKEQSKTDAYSDTTIVKAEESGVGAFFDP
jgi:hypothetical protein